MRATATQRVRNFELGIRHCLAPWGNLVWDGWKDTWPVWIQTRCQLDADWRVGARTFRVKTYPNCRRYPEWEELRELQFDSFQEFLKHLEKEDPREI